LGENIFKNITSVPESATITLPGVVLLFVQPELLQRLLQRVVLLLQHALQVLVTQNGVLASFKRKGKKRTKVKAGKNKETFMLRKK
jgi:hypothetical protein